MPTWGQILGEITNLGSTGHPAPVDEIRNRYVAALAGFTGRNTIVYATKWTGGEVPPNLTSINDEDVQGFMQAVHGLDGNSLDLILHTPGEVLKRRMRLSAICVPNMETLGLLSRKRPCRPAPCWLVQQTVY